MGLTISYTIRLSGRKAVPTFLAEARAEGKRLGWKARRGKADAPSLELIPHPKCEPVRLDFTGSLACEEIVKNSDAPVRTHMQVVEFLRAMQGHAKSLRVEDETEYWETGDKALLKKHMDTFDRAAGRRPSRTGEAPMTLILGSMVYKPDARGKMRLTRHPGQVLIVE